MVADPKRQLHELVDRLSEDEARRLSRTLSPRGTDTDVRSPRPLTEADILRTEPVLPDDETADELIATVRRWRQEGGHA